MLFQAGRNRPSELGGTGSISARRAASERRRRSRSTWASMNSRPSPTGRPDNPVAPAGRNSPSASRPPETSRRSPSVTTAMPRPNLAAGSTAVNGPRVRAKRPRSRPSGSVAGSRKEGAIPVGSAVPSASRSTAASVGSAHTSAPAIRTRIARRDASSAASNSAAEISATLRCCSSSVLIGPRTLSRSAISSADRARRPSLRCCRSASVLLTAAGSSRSRSASPSPEPSSSASRPGSTVSAAARRSASGESPSYRNWADVTEHQRRGER